MRFISNAARKHKVGATALNILEPIACMLLLVVSKAYLVDGGYNPFMFFDSDSTDKLYPSKMPPAQCTGGIYLLN